MKLGVGGMEGRAIQLWHKNKLEIPGNPTFLRHIGLFSVGAFSFGAIPPLEKTDCQISNLTSSVFH